MTGLSFLRALLCAKARQQRDLRDLASQAEEFRENWEKAEAQRKRLLVALRTAAAGQRQYFNAATRMPSAQELQTRREHGLVATAYTTAAWFVEGDLQPLYGLVPDGEVKCPQCFDRFDVVEWVEEEATVVGDVIVCAMCAKALVEREARQ